MRAAANRRLVRNALRALIIALLIPLTTVLATPAHAAGTISGTVIAIGGAPLTNVEVTAYMLNDVVDPPVWEIKHVTSTDANGVYSLAIPTNGTYKVGFADFDGIYESEFYNNATTVDVADDVVVAGSPVTANATLAPKGWVSGTVSDADGGAPINEVDVVLYEYGADSTWDQVEYTQTDTDGNYQIYASPGTYRVGFDGTFVGFSSEYYDDVAEVFDGTNVLVNAGVATEPIDATLDSLGLVSGHVTDSVTDNPIDGIDVAFYANQGTTQLPDWQWESGVQTDANGYYEYAGSNPIRVGFEDPDQVYAPEFYNNLTNMLSAQTIDLSTGDLVPGVDAALAIAGHITGTVTDTDDQALSGIDVAVYRNDGTVLLPRWEVVSGAQTDIDGNYDIPVGADTYRVGFFTDFGTQTYYDAADSVETANDVVVAGSATVPNINGVLASAPETVTNTSAPKISGTAKVGSTLKASAGTWSPTGATFSYTWLAAGKTIQGAASSSLKLTGAQVDKQISVLVTASKAGSDDGAALAAPTAKVVVKPAIKLTSKVKKTKVTLKIQLTASGINTVAGKVKIFRKSTLLETVKLKSGRVKVKLTGQPQGKAKYTAKYLGSGPVLSVKKSIKVAV